jgi:dolichyl-phosphate-mannose--protein O-mannosyl transferase
MNDGGLRNRFPVQKRDYEPIQEEMKPKVRVLQTIPKGSALVCLFLTVIALWTRLYKINWSNHVVWDEAHFGYISLM